MPIPTLLKKSKGKKGHRKMIFLFQVNMPHRKACHTKRSVFLVDKNKIFQMVSLGKKTPLERASLEMFHVEKF